MAFTFVRNLTSNHSPVAAPKDVTKYKIASGQGADMGSVMRFSSGELNKVTSEEEDAAVVLLEDGDGEDEVRVQWILPGHVYKAPVGSGTIDDHYEVGKCVAFEDEGSVELDSSDGPLVVVGKDKLDENFVLVAFNSCLLSLSEKSSQ